VGFAYNPAPLHTRYHLKIRPSAWVFATVAFLVQLSAWNTGTNILYLVASAIASFLVAGFGLTWLSLRGVKIRREAPSAVHRDDSFGISLFVTNTRRYLSLVSLRVTGGIGGVEDMAYIPALPRGTAAHIRLSGAFAKRGVRPLRPVVVKSAFPFGLFERTIILWDGAEVVVYPKVRTVRMGKLDELQGMGETPRLRVGDSDEFFSLRDYVPGDDLRRISWRVSARAGHLVVRDLEPSTSHNIIVGLDTRRVESMADFEDRFEDAIDLAASLALTFLNRQYSVAIATPDGGIAIGDGNSHALKILDMLARVLPVDLRLYGDDWFDPGEERRSMGYVILSPDPSRWGRSAGFRGARILHPKEVIRA
jgi:uncharacterized protein (DUF58 family)